MAHLYPTMRRQVKSSENYLTGGADHPEFPARCGEDQRDYESLADPGRKYLEDGG